MDAFSTRAHYQSFLITARTPRAGVLKYTPECGGRSPRHFHVEPEFNLIVAGSATFGIGDTTVNVTAGDLLGFPPGQDHELLGGSPDLFLYAIGVAPEYSAEILRTIRADACSPLRLRLSGDTLADLEKRSASLVDTHGADSAVGELWEQFHWLRQRQGGTDELRSNALTRRTLSAIHDDPRVDIQGLAGKMRTNRTLVSRTFHADLGLTVVRYRTRVRLFRFISFVDSGMFSLAGCATKAGFGSYSQCHRAFQAELGCCPREYFFAGVRQKMQDARGP